MGPISRRTALLGAAASLLHAGPGMAAETLQIVCFPGAVSLPLVAARSLGYFQRHGIEVDITFTPNSQQLRDGLASGRYHVAHAAVDNAVAMQEIAGVEIAVIVGGDNGFNHLFAQADIETITRLRGRNVTVDAPNTAFALQLYKMLQLSGLDRGDYVVKPIGATDLRLNSMLTHRDEAATMLSLGAAARARDAGFKDLGTAVDVIGPYLATSGFVLRRAAWLASDLAARYLAAYVEGVRWVLDVRNQAAAVAMLAETYKLPAPLGTAVWAIMTDRRDGLSKDAALDVAGFRNVLALRADLEGQWNGRPPAPETYIEARYYAEALKLI